jgi:hypothetical protein
MTKNNKEKKSDQDKDGYDYEMLRKERKRETNWLKMIAGITTVYLTVMLILSLGYSVRQISSISSVDTATIQIILLCIYTGTLGSSVMALRSIIDRIAFGWELSDGSKLPKKEPPDKFVGKMLPGFLARPFLGSAAGFLVFLAVTSGYWIAISPNSSVEFIPFGLGFLAFLGGLFAKTFFIRLKGVFDKSFVSP